MEIHNKWSILGPVMSDIFISDVGSRIECPLSRFADDAKQIGVVSMQEGRRSSRVTWTYGEEGGPDVPHEV